MRLFLALWPDADTRRRLAFERDRWGWSSGGAPVAVPSGRLHVTMHFIGPVASERLPQLASAVRVPFEPFVLTFGRHALWRNGIAALEPLGQPPELIALHAALRDALDALALPLDQRRYRPHVTLARDARGSIAPQAAPAFDWTVDGYALVESRPRGGYVVVASY